MDIYKELGESMVLNRTAAVVLFSDVNIEGHYQSLLLIEALLIYSLTLTSNIHNTCYGLQDQLGTL